MNTFQKVLDLPGAATIMAAKIIGRVIDQVARGFGEDPTLADELCLFRAIEAKYQKDTISMPKMFKNMVARAKTETVDGIDSGMENLSADQKALWDAEDDATEKQALLDSMPELTKLFLASDPDPERWDDMPAIAQWSLLNATEATLPDKVALYKSWADRDRIQNKLNTNAMRLETDANDAIEPLFFIITEFLEDEDIKNELAVEAESGTNVPPRLVQKAA
jgi:hypothetical protein